jgi:putative ABC transport system substrate-binding protein
MDRRQVEFALLSLGFAPMALGQHTGKVFRVGLIFTTSLVSEMEGPQPSHPSARAFVQQFKAMGYQEGQNLVIERRSAEGKFDRFGGIVQELVALRADAIVTVGDDMALEAKRVTATVPIVATIYGDPVKSGLVPSLARPSGNVTGLVVTAGPEIEGKRLQLLKETLSRIHRAAFLGMQTDWEDQFGKTIRAAALQEGVSLLHASHSPNEYGDAFAMIIRNRPDAVIVANTPTNFANRRLIVDFMLNNHLPGIYSRAEYAEAGGMMSYGTHVPDILRRAAIYVDKILKGAKPGDLPIEQPTKFELVVNMKTAKALGLKIPQSILLRADRVIE